MHTRIDEAPTMANTHRLPYAPNLPYYVSTRSVPKDGTEETQTTFEFRDRNNFVVKTPPSETVPVCMMEIPLTSLPCDHQTYIVRSNLPPTFHRFVLYSNGCLTFRIAATDAASAREYRPHLLDYVRIVATGMAGCLNLPFLEDLGVGRKQGLRVISASDVSEVQFLEGPGRFNVGKMFAERLLGTSAPFSNFTPVLKCATNMINYPSGSTSAKNVQVEVPSYELVQSVAAGNANRLEGWGQWSVVSAQHPFSKANNTQDRVLAFARWHSTSNLGVEYLAPGESNLVAINYPLFIVFQE